MHFLQFCTCMEPRFEHLVNPKSTISCEGLCGKSFPATTIMACLDCLANDYGLFWYCDECREKKLLYEIHEAPNSPERDQLKRSSSDPELESSSRKVARVEEIEQLPAELWTEIFRRLTMKQLLAVRRVCHRWKNVVDSSSVLTAKLLLQFPEFFIVDRDYAPENLLPASVACFNRVQFTTVGSWWSSVGQGLVEIRMLHCNFLLPNLLKLLKFTPNLKELVLTDLMIDTLDDRPVMADFQLDKLEMFSVDEIAYPGHLGALLDLFPNVKEFALLNDTGGEEYLNVLLKLPQVLKDIRNTLHTFQASVTDHFLEQLKTLKLPKLRRLYLHECFESIRNDQALLEFCRAHPTLEELHMDKVKWSNVTIPLEIEMSLPNLRKLTIMIPNPPEIQPTLEFATNLRYLFLKGFFPASPMLTFASECPHLEELVLQHLTFKEPQSLSRFLAQSQRIRELHIENCDIGSWSTILRAIRTQKHLQRLTLCQLNIEDAGRCCIDYMDNLTQLVLDRVNKVYQQPLVALLTACSRVKGLTMISLKDGVDRVVLEVMAEKLRMLRQLKIENCALPKADQQFVRKQFGFVEKLIISESE